MKRFRVTACPAETDRNSQERLANSLAVCLLTGSLLLFSLATAQALSDQALAQIRFEQKLNAQVSLTLPFFGDDGKEVKLGQFFGRKPVLLVLGYYECPMLCTMVVNGMVECAADMKWSIGREYEVINVSINPREKPALAAAKKRTYVKRYGRTATAQGWHFLTGSETAIQQLANEVGFLYAYDSASRQYAHPSGLIILTPEGKVSRYLFGVTFAPKDLYEALRDASSNKVSSPVQQFILLCFHYNPITGKYSSTIMSTLRLLSFGTVAGMVWWLFVLSRRPASREPASRREATLTDATHHASHE